MAISDARGRVIAVAREREPYELAVLALCLAYAAVCSWDFELAATAIRTYPFYGGRVFLGLLVLGAGTALAGALRNTLTGMKLEKAGLSLLASVCAGYLVWAPFAIGWRGIGLMLFLGALGALPAVVVARRLGRIVDAAERALDGEEGGDAAGAQ